MSEYFREVRQAVDGEDDGQHFPQELRRNIVPNFEVRSGMSLGRCGFALANLAVRRHLPEAWRALPLPPSNPFRTQPSGVFGTTRLLGLQSQTMRLDSSIPEPGHDNRRPTISPGPRCDRASSW